MSTEKPTGSSRDVVVPSSSDTDDASPGSDDASSELDASATSERALPNDRRREVLVGDGVEFLRRAADRTSPLPTGAAIFTSLPDHSEIPSLDVPAWKTWFVDAVSLACRAVADDAVAVFYQTDVKYDGRWIDKAHMVMCGVDAAGSHALFHKIVCRVQAGITTFGRPAYAHLIAVSRERRLSPGASTPDVLPELGRMTWARAMGGAAVKVAMDFIVSTGATCVVDPFCGHGTALAAANIAGMNAIGVELSRRRAAKARAC